MMNGSLKNRHEVAKGMQFGNMFSNSTVKQRLTRCDYASDSFQHHSLWACYARERPEQQSFMICETDSHFFSLSIRQGGGTTRLLSLLEFYLGSNKILQLNCERSELEMNYLCLSHAQYNCTLFSARFARNELLSLVNFALSFDKLFMPQPCR